MARKIPVKLVMQYRGQGFSRNMIAKTQKVGRSVPPFFAQIFQFSHPTRK